MIVDKVFFVTGVAAVAFLAWSQYTGFILFNSPGKPMTRGAASAYFVSHK